MSEKWIDRDPTNEERAATALAAMDSQEKYDDARPEALGESIADLVADLLHLAKENNIDPELIITRSRMNFKAEVEEEADPDHPDMEREIARAEYLEVR